MTMADTIAVMNKGRIERLGDPMEIYDDPRTRFVANFLGASNLMDGQVDGDAVVLAGGDRLHLPPRRLPASGNVSLGVRPEKIHVEDEHVVSSHPNHLSAIVSDSSFIGISTHYLVQTKTAGELAVVHQNRDGKRFLPGANVTISWAPEHMFMVEG